MKKAIILSVGVILLMVVGCAPKPDYSAFAQCLTDSGMELYGAVWCPHCKDVKENFGNAFRFLTYFECSDAGSAEEQQRCEKTGVDYLPTFKFGDGTKLFGELSFELISQKTGCALP